MIKATTTAAMKITTNSSTIVKRGVGRSVVMGNSDSLQAWHFIFKNIRVIREIRGVLRTSPEICT
jgi:hypothetical protein